MDMHIRPATSSERPAVFNVLDGALLAIEYDRVTELLENDQVHVAVTDTDPERIVGVAVLEDEEILAIAVRRRRRGQGIGTALVTHLKQRNDRLVACFDGRVAQFWQAMGFISQSSSNSGRLRGVWESA